MLLAFFSIAVLCSAQGIEKRSCFNPAGSNRSHLRIAAPALARAFSAGRRFVIDIAARERRKAPPTAKHPSVGKPLSARAVVWRASGIRIIPTASPSAWLVFWFYAAARRDDRTPSSHGSPALG